MINFSACHRPTFSNNQPATQTQFGVVVDLTKGATVVVDLTGKKTKATSTSEKPATKPASFAAYA